MDIYVNATCDHDQFFIIIIEIIVYFPQNNNCTPEIYICFDNYRQGKNLLNTCIWCKLIVKATLGQLIGLHRAGVTTVQRYGNKHSTPKAMGDQATTRQLCQHQTGYPGKPVLMLERKMYKCIETL